MTGAEVLLRERNANEVLMLRAYVEQVSKRVCGRHVWGDMADPAARCGCFSCAARECLEQVEAMRRMWTSAGQA